MNHISLDLETMGTRHDAAIISIGAVRFTEDGRLGENYHENVSLETSMAAGLSVSGSTIGWWLSQSDAARGSIVDPHPTTLIQALESFAAFIGLDATIWAHATFDPVILSNAYLAVGFPVPWHYRSVRDLRTIQSLVPKEVWKVDLEGHVPHSALSDARVQADSIMRCMAWLDAKSSSDHPALARLPR